MLGPLDLHLFNEGTHRRLWTVLGPQPAPGGTAFAVWAPNARHVGVVGDWNGWEVDADALRPQGTSGVWAGVAAGAEPGHRYKLAVEDRWGHVSLRADPMARQAEVPPATASVIPEPSRHEWQDAEWMARRDATPAGEQPLRIYEVHLASFRPGLNYRELADALAEHVSWLGFTHVELLPVAEHPFGGSWGYQVTGYYAPTSRFGTPDDFRAFVDRLHAQGIGVILDWVPAHFPRDDWALARFDGTALYEHADPRQGEHPEWGTLVFNYGRHEVRNFLVANALYWFEEFHIDGLRVDAVASMLYLDYARPPGSWVPNEHGGRENMAAVHFLQDLNREVFGAYPGALMIAEESTSWQGVSHPVHHGGLGFSHKWNMGWMHDTLGYFATDPVHRRWHHRDLTFGLLYAFSEQFVLPLSHDEVVHGKASLVSKMPGDEWQRFANLRALLAWQWALPGAPLLFMGGELGRWDEWREDESLPLYLLDHAHHRGVRDLVATMNHVARAWPALWQRDHEPGGFQWLDADDALHSTYSFLRWGRDGHQVVVCVANLTPVPRVGFQVGVPWTGPWQVLLDTDAPVFWGSGLRDEEGGCLEATDAPWQSQPASVVVDLPPLAVLWFGAERP